MTEESKPSGSIRFFTGVLLVVGILSSLSLLSLALKLGHIGSGPLATPLFFVDVLNAMIPVFYLFAYVALKKRSPYGRWMAVTAFTFSECVIVGALWWYLVVYSGPKNAALTAFVIVMDVIQFVLFGWGALTFAFPPKVDPDDTVADSYLPPPPPTFDD